MNITKKISLMAVTAAAVSLFATLPVQAADNLDTSSPTMTFLDYLKMPRMKQMAMMDKNGDHMVTKEEFMAFHEAMWEKMDKKKTGMIEARDWLRAISGRDF